MCNKVHEWPEIFTVSYSFLRWRERAWFGWVSNLWRLIWSSSPSIERVLNFHPHPIYKLDHWGRYYRLQLKSVNSETMKIFRILSLSLASAYEQFDYESELGLARWVFIFFFVGGGLANNSRYIQYFRGRGQREGEIMAYSFNGEEDADEMMQALFSLAGQYIATIPNVKNLTSGTFFWQ